jgi:hypothetical protein
MPLLKKQWEVLLPFRSQILHRATASLRSRRNLDPKTLSETLLAIMLLDNLPLNDILDLFLSQRTKAFNDTIAHETEDSRSSSHLSTGTESRRRRASSVSKPTHLKTDVSKMLEDAVVALLETVSLSKAVFERKPRLNESESLIEEMARLIQVDDTVSVTPQISTTPHTPHRRASRLVTMALPRSVSSNSTKGPPISSTRVLQALPSSQILLHHLPQSISGFTPFITPSGPPLVNDKLQAWQSKTISLLQDAIPAGLAALTSVADVWAVRQTLRNRLESGAFEDKIREALEGQWAARIKDIWDDKLAVMVTVAEESVRQAGERIRDSIADIGELPVRCALTPADFTRCTS